MSSPSLSVECRFHKCPLCWPFMMASPFTTNNVCTGVPGQAVLGIAAVRSLYRPLFGTTPSHIPSLPDSSWGPSTCQIWAELTVLPFGSAPSILPGPWLVPWLSAQHSEVTFSLSRQSPSALFLPALLPAPLTLTGLHTAPAYMSLYPVLAPLTPGQIRILQPKGSYLGPRRTIAVSPMCQAASQLWAFSNLRPSPWTAFLFHSSSICTPPPLPHLSSSCSVPTSSLKPFFPPPPSSSLQHILVESTQPSRSPTAFWVGLWDSTCHLYLPRLIISHFWVQ